MKLKSFGCSFIYGNDLHDDGCGEHWSTPSAYTWPGVIAARLSVEYQCFAKAGSGNLQILDKILTHVAIEDVSTVYVIGWTWSDRFDFVATEPDPRWQDDWRTICPVTDSKIAEHYYRELHSELRDKLSTLIHINTAVDILREKNIPFVMTYMDDIIFDRRWHAPLSVCSLQDRVRPHLHNFDGKTFLDWSRDSGFEISATHHPLKPAHVAAADYMFDKVSAEFNKLAQSTQ
jgi:hypothetical protein